MSILNTITEELSHEAANTKKILSAIPTDKFDWKPHDKSMCLKQLAVHISDLALFPHLILTTDELNLADLNSPEVSNANDLLNNLDFGVDKSLKALKSADEKDLKKTWVMKFNEQVIMDVPKIEALRIIGLNHSYHHRGQLSVYLRLLDIPVPGMYGPSADEQ